MKSSSAALKGIFLLFLLMLALRVISLVCYPLMDMTESRYAEIARMMVETHSWITPQIDYNIPFWGKPPLAIWASAAGIKLLGATEFAVRFPHFLAALATLALTAYFARRHQMKAIIPMAILMTCPVFVISSGSVMTDMYFCLSVSLSMVGFYFAFNEESEHPRLWAYAGFIGLGLGLLSKGPLILVLTGSSIGVWLFWQYGWRRALPTLWKRVPLLSGMLLMLAIAAPWYVMAERATPGFFEYFIVGEHFKRFVERGWQGDLYGVGHQRRLGTVWYYLLVIALPWSIGIFALLRQQWGSLRKRVRTEPLLSFCLCWFLAPMLFFTFASNLLYTYILPAMPAFAMMIAIFLKEQDYKWVRYVLTLDVVLAVIAITIVAMGVANKTSDKFALSHVEAPLPVFYYGEGTYSGKFYSEGTAQIVHDLAHIPTGTAYYIVGVPDQVEPALQAAGDVAEKQLDMGRGRSLYLGKPKQAKAN